MTRDADRWGRAGGSAARHAGDVRRVYVGPLPQEVRLLVEKPASVLSWKHDQMSSCLVRFHVPMSLDDLVEGERPVL
jgi:hypothetical protein